VIRPNDRAFIERMDMFFLATADASNQPQCSYKSGEPGFVRALDEHNVAFSNYDGNGMYLSIGNLAVNPQVGMLFIDFVSEHLSRLRLNGSASIDDRDELLDDCPEAQFVRVRATQVFPNCVATSTGWRWSSVRGATHPSRRRAALGPPSHSAGF
jgi:predicted pyridoxine 5'-phosphate oxidase superfamily flavin-nucleotide-binding protein